MSECEIIYLVIRVFSCYYLNMKEIIILNPENATESEIDSYKTREASRAVVFDVDDNIALLHVSKKNYYKLPGGGIDTGENKIDALKRECNEEIGCDIGSIEELGVVIEFRKIFQLKQTSYCYKAKVSGVKRDPSFTNSEIDDGFEIVWVSVSEAQNLLRNFQTNDKKGLLYIIPRDLKILEAASLV